MLASENIMITFLCLSFLLAKILGYYYTTSFSGVEWITAVRIYSSTMGNKRYVQKTEERLYK